MSGTELARQATHLPTVADAGFLEEVRTQIAPKATDSELRFFATVVEKTQLDPWSRQIYLIGRWDGRAKREVHRPQVSIDGLRLTAERSNKYDGQTPVEWCGEDGAWRDTWLAPEAPRAARVGVFKSGRSVATYAVAHFDEYVVTGKDGKPQGLWRDKPRVMIGKCAEALALRKVFPQETSGLYIAEEMGRADVESTAVDITDQPVVEVAAGVVVEPEPAAPVRDNPSPAGIQALLGLAVEAGHGAAVEEGGDQWHTLRLMISLAGASPSGEIEAVVGAMTRAQFEETVERLVEEKSEREAGNS